MKRGSPLKRTGSLRRKTYLRSRGKSAYRRRPRNLDYMRWVRHQPCCAKVHGGLCGGRVEADHAGRRGIGQKAPDGTCIALCHNHHVWRTSFSGPFKSWKQDQMRGWLATEVIRHNHEYSIHLIRG